MQIFCSDVEHNKRTEVFPLTTSVVCDCDMLLPFLPKGLKSFPRYVVDLKPHVNGPGRWINVLFEDDRVVRFFTSQYEDLKSYIQDFCSVCSIPNHQCRCPAIVNADACWKLFKSAGVEITNNRMLNRATYQTSHIIYAEVEFTQAVTQSSKMYTSALNDVGEAEPLVKLTEDVVTLYWNFRSSSGTQDLLCAALAFVRSVTGRSTSCMLKDILEQLLVSTFGEARLQSDVHWTETLSDLYENYSRAKNTILANRLKKVFNHIIAHSIYHKLGIEVDRKMFEDFEKNVIRVNLVECATFVEATIGLITFLLKQGRQCMLTGEYKPLFISGESTSEWYERASKTLMRFESVCNPRAIGVDLHDLLHELEVVLKEGKCLLKYTNDHRVGNVFVTKMVVDLEKTYNAYLVSCAACAVRKTPFGVCIYGSPGIGKGSILDTLFLYDAKLRNKPTHKSYRYPHPADSDHFDNFSTWQHAIVFEDVAQIVPSKMQNVDPSVQFFMKAINNQPWCPPQAALERKGSTPVLVDTVYVTSNTLDLNIPKYYQHTYAPMRRFPLHIEPIVKKQFRRKDGGIDFNEAKSVPGKYDDFWEFKIRVPKEKGNNPSFIGEFVEEPDLYCKDMESLLKLYKKMCLEHHRKEEAMLQKFSDAEQVYNCERCSLPKYMCECPAPEVQVKREYFDGFMSAAPEVVRQEEQDSYASSQVSQCPDTACLSQLSSQKASPFEDGDSYASSQVSQCPDTTNLSELSSQTAPFSIHSSHVRSLPHIEEEECKENGESYASSQNSLNPDQSFLSSGVNSSQTLSHSSATLSKCSCASSRVSPSSHDSATVSNVLTEEEDINTRATQSLVPTTFGKFLSWFFKKDESVEPEPLSEEEKRFREEFGDDFFKEAKDAFCVGYRFGEVQFPDANIGAWRNPRIPKRKPRSVTNTLLSHFLMRFANRKDAAIKYINMHLNDSLDLGYSDGEIALDFLRWCKNQEERKALEELDGVVDVMMKSGNVPKTKKGSVFDYLVQCVIYFYFQWSWFRWTVNTIGSKAFIRRRLMPLIRPALVRSENQKYFMKRLGNFLDRQIGSLPRWGQALLVALSAAGSLAAFYAVGNFIMKRNSDRGSTITIVETVEEEVQELQIKEPSVELQMGTFPQPLREDKKKNPWVVPERTVTALDFSTKRITESNAMLRNLAYNTLVVSYRGKDVAEYVMRFRMLALNEHTFLTNNHSLPPQKYYDLAVHFGDVNGGDTVRVRIQEQQIRRFEERDIAIIQTCGIPNRFKRIQNNFPRRSYEGVTNGFVLIKEFDGSVKKKELVTFKKSHLNRRIDGVMYDYSCHYGTAPTPTETGDSGSPWIAETGYGLMIVGIHTLLFTNGVMMCSNIFLEDIQEWSSPMVATVGEIEVATPLVQKEKSYIDYHKEKYITYHGELSGHRQRPKHHVYETEIAEQCYGRRILNHLIERRLTGPVMDNWRPQQVSLSEFVTPVSTMDETIVESCFKVFEEHLWSSVSAEEMALLHPYPLEVAVNGAPGIKFVDGIKKSTSMGYPWKKTKRAFLVPLEDETFQEGVQFTPEVEARILERLERLKQGVRTHPVFSASLKDEPVSFKKFNACKTRVFFCCPADYLIIVRMCFMSLCRVAQRNPLQFGVAIGMNPHSNDWDKLYHHLAGNPTCNTVAGDHVFYDKKMQLMFLKQAMLFVIRLYEKAGQVSAEELVVYYTIVDDMVNPSVDYFGMLVTFMGGEVSGHQMTTILNCILDKAYIMYAYHATFGQVEDFFEHVRITTLGDDHVFTVSDERRELNHTQVQKVLKELGLDYTMAEKDADSVPFIELKDAPFLKRKFVYSPELQSVVGPIEVNTIFKMLTVSVAKKDSTPEERLAQALCAASSEAFFHGREFFEAFTAFVDRLDKSPRLREQIKQYPPLTWEGYVKRFREASATEMATRAGHVEETNQKSAHIDSYCFDGTPTLQSLKRMGQCVTNPARAFPEIHIYGRLELEPKEGGKDEQSELTVCLEKQQLATTQDLTGNYAAQAVPETAQESTDQIQETTMFVNEPRADVVDIAPPLDSVFDKQETIAQLGNFLKRPVLIHQYRWTENGAPGLKSSFYPFRLYFNTPAIKNKIQGFGFLRAKLKLKFLINGSPFYYGKIGAFYRPGGDFENNNVPTNTPARLAQICVSQRPHVWLDNQSTSTEEMILPFLWPQSYISTSQVANFQGLGVIELWQYAALRSANGVTTTGIDISVYAYCDEFDLSGPTAKAMVQSSKEYKGDGQISGPASTVASVAHKLRNVPVIGAYATATETAANMVGSVANFFGFTNVPVVEDVKPLKPIPFQLASSSISEPVMKLSLQPKQEIAIGGAQDGGSNEDELQIQKLLERESFLCGSLWTTTSAINDTLFIAAVTPSFYDFDGTTQPPSVAHTALSYWSCLFDYWRGPIIFRFKVVRSQYHRGRININWDSRANKYDESPGVGDASTMNVVLDLDESDEVEIEIPYAQAQLFLPTITSGWDAMPTSRTWENSGAVVSWPGSGNYNGVISVKVMNRLTAPEASSDVDVLVFVRAGKGFQLAAPTEIDPNWTHSALSAAAQSEKVYTLGNKGEDDMIFREVFGENITSLRELLHRSVLSYNWIPNLSSTVGSFNVVIPVRRYPRPPGLYPNGWDLAVVGAAGQACNFSRMTHLNWVLPAFVGYKGSVNVTFNAVNAYDSKCIDRMEVCRRIPSQSKTSQTRRPDFFSLDNTLSRDKKQKKLNTPINWGHDGLAGAALTNQKTNAGLVVNLPYYVTSKFLSTSPYNQYDNNDIFTNSEEDWFEFNAVLYKENADNFAKGVYFQVYYASGPDFDVVFNLNTPIVYFADRAGN